MGAMAVPIMYGVMAVGSTIMAASMSGASAPPPPPPPTPPPPAPTAGDDAVQAKVEEEQRNRMRADKPQDQNLTKGSLMSSDPYNLSGDEKSKQRTTLLGGA